MHPEFIYPICLPNPKSSGFQLSSLRAAWGRPRATWGPPEDHLTNIWWLTDKTYLITKKTKTIIQRTAPKKKLTIFVKLPSLIVESMRNFVSNNPSNSSIIQISRSVIGKKYALQNSSWELNWIFKGAVECINNCGSAVMYPVGFVNLSKNKKQKIK